jgi:hypothetical protein
LAGGRAAVKVPLARVSRGLALRDAQIRRTQNLANGFSERNCHVATAAGRFETGLADDAVLADDLLDQCSGRPKGRREVIKALLAFGPLGGSAGQAAGTGRAWLVQGVQLGSRAVQRAASAGPPA